MNDFTQENNLWQTLQAECDAEEQHRQLVELARLLLERTATDAAILDTDVLTDLLLEYQAAGAIILQFLQSALPHLDEAYRGETFEQQLQQLSQALATTQQQAQILKTQAIGLNAEKQQLMLQKQSLQAEADYVEKLKISLTTLRADLSALQLQIAQCEALESEVKPLSFEAVNSIVKLVPAIIGYLQVFQQNSQSHLEADLRIAEVMLAESTLEGMEDSVSRISSLQQIMENTLSEFDDLLRDIIERNEAQQRQLRALREPG